MKSVTLHSHADPDGVLNLRVPVGLPNADLEVMVIIVPLPKSPQELGWTPGFFEQTAGAWQGAPLARESQGDYETRDDLK
jgi:hypothetical protein